MKVGVVNKKLIMLRNKEMELNYGTYNINSYFDKQVVNDFVINNFKHYKDKIIYNSSILKYLEEFYEIEKISKNEFLIKEIKYDIIGYVKVTIVENKNEYTTDFYIANPIDNYKQGKSDRIIYPNTELFKQAVIHYSSVEEFYINDIKYNVQELVLFGTKDEIVPLFKNYTDDIKIAIIKKKILKSTTTYKKYIMALIDKKGKLVLRDVYINKLIGSKKYYMLENEIISPSEYGLEEDVILKNKDANKMGRSINNSSNNEVLVKKRVIDLTSKNYIEIDKLYVYEQLNYKYLEDYEEVLYIFNQINGNTEYKQGYYLKYKKIYIIAREQIKKIDKYVFNIMLVDNFGSKIYDPNQENNMYDNLVKQSFLFDMGYNVKAETSKAERIEALKKAIKKYGKPKVERKLRSLIYNSRNNMNFIEANKKREEDLQWLIDNYDKNARKVKIKCL